MSTRLTRTVVACLGAVLLAMGVVMCFRLGPLLITMKSGVSLGWLPFWVTACLAIGLVLLVLPWLLGGNGGLGWSACLLVALWVFQFSGLAGVYIRPVESVPTTLAWLNRQALVSSDWWALALLVVIAVLAAIAGKWRFRSPTRDDRQATKG